MLFFNRGFHLYQSRFRKYLSDFLIQSVTFVSKNKNQKTLHVLSIVLKKFSTAGVTQRNDPPPPYKMTPRVILLRRGMTRVIILRRKMTPDRRKRTPSSCSRMTPS